MFRQRLLGWWHQPPGVLPIGSSKAFVLLLLATVLASALARLSEEGVLQDLLTLVAASADIMMIFTGILSLLVGGPSGKRVPVNYDRPPQPRHTPKA